jgi:site-specific DNA-methyltransferase (adenine-specific)
MNIRMIPLHEIKPYENNAKQHPVRQLEAIVNSIQQFGFRQPLVITNEKVIVCGHARYEAAATIGLSDIPCEIADDLTEEQLNAYRILDNEIAAMGKTDLVALNIELQKLPDFDFKPFNLDMPEITNFEPVSIDEQGKLDEKNPVTCPNCNHEFIP